MVSLMTFVVCLGTFFMYGEVKRNHVGVHIHNGITVDELNMHMRVAHVVVQHDDYSTRSWWS